LKHKAFFLALEGIDGSGTTTHCRLLAGFLEKQKGFKVFLTQEPSNSEIGVLIRKFLKNETIPFSTDALMFAADRDLHYTTEIKKKLDEGYIVISNRYLESSVVYQSAQSNKISMDWILTINKFAGKPDLTILLDIDPKIALERKNPLEPEKFENVAFLEKVRGFYLKRAKQQKYPVISSDDIIEFVQEKIQKIVLDSLKKRNVCDIELR